MQTKRLKCLETPMRCFHGTLPKFRWANTRKSGYIEPDLRGKKPTHIIIGGGTTGCILANRLTEDPSNRVLLLEAGPKDNWWKWRLHNASAHLLSTFVEDYNWNYFTVTQPNLNDRVLYLSCGRIWGGSSSVGNLVWSRGDPVSYNNLENEFGSHWSAKNLDRYFEKVEKNFDWCGDEKNIAASVQFKSESYDNPLCEAFTAACSQMNLISSDDMRKCLPGTFGYGLLCMRNGKRCSTSTAYLKPVLKRPNLHTSSGITCTRILFNGMRAVGIEFIRKQNFYGTMEVDSYSREKVYCAGSVILCAGPVNTPQLLMLSGIGPAQHLRSHEITVVQNMPGVGQNLRDHLELPIKQKCTKYQNLFGKQSWLPHPIANLGTLHTDSINRVESQLCFVPLALRDGDFRVRMDNAYEVRLRSAQCDSSGHVMLAHRDPRRPPLINPNYLSAFSDFGIFRRGLYFTRELLRKQSFDDFRGKALFTDEDFNDDAQVEDFIRSNVTSAYSLYGTCKMGSGHDSSSVVNHETLLVHGFENLMIVDASIIPSSVGGNPLPIVAALAEKASDQIQGK